MGIAEGRCSFLKKRTKRLFSDAVAVLSGGTNTQIRKSLLLIFFRKEGLPSSLS
jgi:hypothetical protein